MSMCSQVRVRSAQAFRAAILRSMALHTKLALFTWSVQRAITCSATGHQKQ